jgi:hypothetical protein
MIGSEYLVLDAAELANSIRLRLYVDGRQTWEGFGPAFLDPLPIVQLTYPTIWDGRLPEVLGGRLFVEALDALAPYPIDQLAIHTLSDRLALARWEDLVRGWIMVDYSGELASRALVPIELPISVLLADLDHRHPYDEHRVRPMHHFATTALGYVSPRRLEHTLSRLPHDIVHIRLHLTDLSGELWIGSPPSGIRARRFATLLRPRGESTRLVILEVDPSETVAASLLARRIRGRDGPSVLVSDGRLDFSDFYYGITHSENLRRAVAHSRRPPAGEARLPRLFISDGGDEILSLFSEAEELTARIAAARERLSDVTARLTRGITETLDFDATALDASLGAPDFGFSAESLGVEPMSDRSIELDQATAAIRRAERRFSRVVNCWFSTVEGAPIPTNRSLLTSTRYGVDVTVGLPAPHSNIAVPFEVDEDLLAKEYQAGGTTVRAVLISDDVEVLRPVQELSVPRPPARSKTLTFDIRTPDKPRRVALRLALYARNNLLQAVALAADVTSPSVVTRAGANEGLVDWALTGRLDDSNGFETKAFSILTNDSGNGSHLIAIESADFRSHVTLGEKQVTTLLRQARAALQWAAGDPRKEHDYRYASNNAGNIHQLRRYLTGIAGRGWDMYDSLLNEQCDDQFENELGECLASSTTIQCARIGASRLMYPWALIYDHPLVKDRGNQLCQEFLDVVQSQRSIKDSQCFVASCPSREDTNLVCPSGFWGFRHIIEQPLGSLLPSDEEVLTGQGDVPQVIHTSESVSAFVGYSTDLDPQGEHVNEVLRLPGVIGGSKSTKKEVGEGLKQPSLNLVYFFCHGGSDDGNPWLGVGGKPSEKVEVSNLRAWGVKWQSAGPLVIINGCETVAAEPDDVSVFHDALRSRRASGVIGSEIRIPVTLGREVGVQLVDAIATQRVTVGEAIREIRLGLLARLNPLGLAFTPYCFARLHME